MSLKKLLNKGSDASWLPTFEAIKGAGGLCSEGWKEFETPTNYRHRCRYRYLPFAPNGINWCPSDHLDVISYNFTGCIMATFTDSGVRKVCHVSTGHGSDCKEVWAKIQKTFTNVLNFKPSDGIRINKEEAFVGCYGLITPDSGCYAITVAKKDTNLFVAGVQLVPPIRPEDSKVPERRDVLKAALEAPLKATL